MEIAVTMRFNYEDFEKELLAGTADIITLEEKED